MHVRAVFHWLYFKGLLGVLELSGCADNYYRRRPVGKAGLLRNSAGRGLAVICTGLTGSDSMAIYLIVWPGVPLELLCNIAAPIPGGEMGAS